jgi:hypothetical protein
MLGLGFGGDTWELVKIMESNGKILKKKKYLYPDNKPSPAKILQYKYLFKCFRKKTKTFNFIICTFFQVFENFSFFHKIYVFYSLFLCVTHGSCSCSFGAQHYFFRYIFLHKTNVLVKERIICKICQDSQIIVKLKKWENLKKCSKVIFIGAFVWWRRYVSLVGMEWMETLGIEREG